MKNKKFAGVIVAIATPVDSEEKLDKKGFIKLIRHVLKGGVNGIFVLGSCGEGPALTEEVKLKTVEACAEEVNGKVPVLVGALETSSRRIIQFVNKIKKYEVDAVVIMPPYYYSAYNEQVIISHFNYVANNVDLPVVLYNLPVATNKLITKNVIKEVMKNKNIIGLKDSSGDFSNFLDILEMSKKSDFPVFQGIESLAGSSLLFQANGIVMGCANIDLATFVSLYRESQKGNLQSVIKLQYRINHLVSVLNEECFYSSMKYALEVLGICSSRITAPMPGISEYQKDKIKNTLEELHLI